MPRQNKILNIGDTAPLFSLPSHRRQEVSLESYKAEQHVVLTFFRGTWWPNSRRQLVAVQELVAEYADHNATPLAIAGQWPRELRGFAERKGITYPLLVDKDRSVIKSYGVYHWLSIETYNIARPSTFIIDKLGIIRYMYIGSHQFDLVDQTELVQCLKSIDTVIDTVEKT